MKIRNGFVSNSSSSSFICEISGEVVSGWDMGLKEAEMVECQSGHVFNESYLKTPLDDIPEYDEELSESESRDGNYEIPIKYCPICNLDVIQNDVILQYILKKNYIVLEEVKKEVRNKFKNLKDLQNYKAPIMEDTI